MKQLRWGLILQKNQSRVYIYIYFLSHPITLLQNWKDLLNIALHFNLARK